MSKRFGRNQKRKLNSELEATKLALSSAESSNKVLRHSIKYNEKAVEETRRILGEYFIGFPAEQIQGDISRDFWTIFKEPSKSLFDISQPMFFDKASSLTRTLQRLEVAKVKTYLDDLRGMQHVSIVSADGKGAAYAFNPNTIRFTSNERLMAEIAFLLSKHFKEAFGV